MKRKLLSNIVTEIKKKAKVEFDVATETLLSDVIKSAYDCNEDLDSYINEVYEKLELSTNTVRDILSSTHLYEPSVGDSVRLTMDCTFEELMHDMKLFDEDCYMYIGTYNEMHTAWLNNEDDIYYLPNYFLYNNVESISRVNKRNRVEWTILLRKKKYKE